MQNSRAVVFFHLVDVGEGSTCCCYCSSCDRVKKSTPSPKTEVWTLDWSLTINQLVLTSVQLILLIMNFLREC